MQHGQAAVVAELERREVDRIVVGPAEEVGVYLQELRAQLVEAALQLADRLVAVVRADERDGYEAVRVPVDEAGHQVVAALRVAVYRAVDAGAVDTGGVHHPQVQIGLRRQSGAAHASDVVVEIDHRGLHDCSIPRSRSRFPPQIALSVDSLNP